MVTNSCTLSDFGAMTINDFEQLGVANPMPAEDFLRQFNWAFPKAHRRIDRESDKPLILSVDDDAVNHLVIRSHLGAYYRIVEAMDGYEALDYIKSDKERPIVVLLDIMMPGMTGLEVVKEIRQTLKLSHTVLPVVILSAMSPLDDTTQESLSHGATDFMPKPFIGRTLQSKVQIYPQVRRDCLTLYQKALQYRRRVYMKIQETCEEGHSSSAADGEDDDLAAAKEEILRLKDELALNGELEEDACGELRQELASAEEEAQKLKSEVECLRAKHQAQQRSSEEEVERLREENRQLRQEAAQARTQLSEAQAEAAREVPGSELAAALEEVARHRREAESARAEAARAIAALREDRPPCKSQDSETTSVMSMPWADRAGSRLKSSALRELKWLRLEKEACEKAMASLVGKLGDASGESLRQQIRADAHDREIQFLKDELTRLQQVPEETASVSCLGEAPPTTPPQGPPCLSVPFDDKVKQSIEVAVSDGQ